jgi:hypothetical protein
MNLGLSGRGTGVTAIDRRCHARFCEAPATRLTGYSSIKMLFVLDTTALSYVDLTASRMRAIDVMLDPQARIHDHFPLVIDFVLRKDGPAR